MNKRFVGLLTAVFLLSQTILPACAENNDSINASIEPGNKIVTVTGTTSGGNEKRIMVTVADSEEKFCYLDQGKTSPDGKFQFTFPMPGAESQRKYTVRVWGGEVKEITTTFTYETKKDETGQTGQTGTVSKEKDILVTVNDGVIKVKATSSNANGDAPVTVDNKLLEQAFSNTTANSNGHRQIIIDLDEANTYQIKLPLDALANKDSKDSIVLNTLCGDINLPCSMFYNMSLSANGSSAVISLKAVKPSNLDEGTKNTIGDRPVVELKTLVDNKSATWGSEAPVTVSIDYKPTPEELKDTEFITVWRLNIDGTTVPVTTGRYDASKGKVVFTAESGGQYSVVNIHKTFKDTDHYKWAKKQIEVMASKGVINGTSADRYEPEKNINRADFAVLLTKCLRLTAQTSSNFDDIKATDYYSDAVSILKELGIASGAGNNKFNPKENISRQDMMVLVDKALKVKGVKSSENLSEILAAFKDMTTISNYASDSIARLVKDGIISGENGNINPSGNTTRAQSAVIIYKLYNKYTINN